MCRCFLLIYTRDVLLLTSLVPTALWSEQFPRVICLGASSPDFQRMRGVWVVACSLIFLIKFCMIRRKLSHSRCEKKKFKKKTHFLAHSMKRLKKAQFWRRHSRINQQIIFLKWIKQMQLNPFNIALLNIGTRLLSTLRNCPGRLTFSLNALVRVTFV